MAAALAGVRLNDRRVVETVPDGALSSLRAKLPASPQTNWLSTWATKLFYELPGQNR